MNALYVNRKLSEGHPELTRRSLTSFSALLEQNDLGHDEAGIVRQLRYLSRLVVRDLRDVVVVGCGPRPHMLKVLLDRGYNALGIEPMTSFVQAADGYLGTSGKVLCGTAEHMPLADASQDLVYCNSVLEHVDSPLQSLAEMQRVLRPGGIAFVITTNRYRVSLRGDNGEYSVPFFNWLPEVVKESFVFHHLHYRPALASYSERPAVHWYSFSDLCRLGRDAGFFQFYSTLDLVSPDDPTVAPSPLKRLILPRMQQNPWLRALALWGTAFGGMIIMLKGRVGDAVPTETNGHANADGHRKNGSGRDGLTAMD
ncbi:MAG TPA: class I SAM-dependent methyltransferase [Polyangia bacterium]|jgi:SAM-dependent methyltransferase|nr:class I SAM-dependent methyltransferase [Polyangia bacterium]